MTEVAGIIFLTVIVEGVITYIFKKKDNEEDPREWIKLVSLGMGVIVSIAYQIDIPYMFGLISSYNIIGYIFSGVIIGRGSNYLNDILSLTKK